MSQANVNLHGSHHRENDILTDMQSPSSVIRTSWLSHQQKPDIFISIIAIIIAKVIFARCGWGLN
jgi:hypothetical protein